MSSDTTERVYRFIVDYIAAHDGLSPSQREIAEGCYIVRSAVLRHLDRLEAWGASYGNLEKPAVFVFPSAVRKKLLRIKSEQMLGHMLTTLQNNQDILEMQ